ncbi:hypothetical protein HDA32_002723 [Spinactinospora alkalitolerans]|uniref:Uncharacterized protein n=1 Tax=Spinactinospora alkalitolerans TaxID=687207 RepID=A0A852TXQ7_9ACTN|nr:hypothetical protein [Spinactinospora alkalitolerans]NYE47603.1 hypothetical protein [Spinactinospora alkalitolerans]
MDTGDAGAARIPHSVALQDLLAAIPLYAPVDGPEQGRITATTTHPGEELPAKVVVDFAGEAGVEIATRRWDTGTGPDPRHVRGFCVERDFMQRRMNGALDARPLPLPEGSAWSQRHIALDGAAQAFTVLSTPDSWVAAAAVPGPFLIRLFATAPRPGLTALRRITSATELQPLRGRA